MAEIQAQSLFAQGIGIDTIRLWLIPCTTRKERDEILAALPTIELIAA